MDVLKNLVYEVKRKTKPMALFSCEAEREEEVKKILEKQKLDFFISKIDNKINVFFGQNPCVNLVREKIGEKKLSDLTNEEDFILGIMLGYDRILQCERFLKRNSLPSITL